VACQRTLHRKGNRIEGSRFLNDPGGSKGNRAVDLIRFWIVRLHYDGDIRKFIPQLKKSNKPAAVWHGNIQNNQCYIASFAQKFMSLIETIRFRNCPFGLNRSYDLSKPQPKYFTGIYQ